MAKEEFEDTKGVIRIHKSKKRTNNDLQNPTRKTKYRVTRTPLRPRVNSGYLEG